MKTLNFLPWLGAVVLFAAPLPATALTPAQLRLSMKSGLEVTGAVGALYAIDYTTNLAQANGWQPLTNLVLPASPYLVPGTAPSPNGCRFYRAVALNSPTNPAHMVFIPPGVFALGSPSNEVDRYDNEGPQTTVTISQGFWIGIYPVTQQEYQSVMTNNPSYFPATSPGPSSRSVGWMPATTTPCLRSAIWRPAKSPPVTSTACRRRRNGSTPAGRGPRPDSITGMTRATPIWQLMPGTGATAAARPSRWDRSPPTRGDCMICAGMSGSGARTGMRLLIRGTASPTRKGHQRERSASCVAAVGTASPGAAAPPAASATIQPPITTTITASGWFWPRVGRREPRAGIAQPPQGRVAYRTQLSVRAPRLEIAVRPVQRAPRHAAGKGRGALRVKASWLQRKPICHSYLRPFNHPARQIAREPEICSQSRNRRPSPYGISFQGRPHTFRSCWNSCGRILPPRWLAEYWTGIFPSRPDSGRRCQPGPGGFQGASAAAAAAGGCVAQPASLARRSLRAGREHPKVAEMRRFGQLPAARSGVRALPLSAKASWATRPVGASHAPLTMPGRARAFGIPAA